jgi:hypothetical protein
MEYNRVEERVIESNVWNELMESKQSGFREDSEDCRMRCVEPRVVRHPDLFRPLLWLRI